MLPSGAELPKSLTDHGNCESCWVQPVAFWMVGGRTPFPSQTMELAWHRRIWPSGPGMVMPRQAASCWQKSRTDQSLLFPMRRTLDEETIHSVGRVWPTCERASAWMLHEPGRWTGTSLMPFRSLTWGKESSGRSVWTIWYRLCWWCTTQPQRCHTSDTLHETCVEAGTRLHSGALPPSLTDWRAGFPAAWTVVAVSKALSETPYQHCRGEPPSHQMENGWGHWNPVWPGPDLLTPGLWCPSRDWAEAKLTSWH